MTNAVKTRLKILILIGVPLSGAGIDIFIPSLPALESALHTTKSAISLTIPVYLLAYGLAQPVFGSLADAYGRRPPLLGGTLLFVLGSLMAAVSGSLELLLTARALQGIGVSGPAVLTKAALTDAFDGEERMAMANTMTIAWAVGPVLSPALGGYLQDYFGWQASFFFLSAYSAAFLLAAAVAWPETGPEKVSARPREIALAYKRILFCSEFILSVSLLALLYGFMIVFNVLGPFLLQRGLGFSPREFGQIVLWLGLAWFMGNLGNKLLSRRFPRGSIVWYGLLSNLVLVLVMVAAAFSRPLEFWSLFVPTFCLFLIGGSIFPNVWGRALSIFPDSAGTASALMGSVLILGVSLASAAAGFLGADSARPLSLFYLALILTSLGIARKLSRYQTSSSTIRGS